MGKTKTVSGGGQQPSKKTEQKKKDKVIEDKTFGLKNKNKSKSAVNFTIPKYKILM